MTLVHIDFETFSEVSLADVGPVVYSKHPSTRILCMSWRTKDDDGIWVSETMPDDHVPLRRLFNKPALDRLFKLIRLPSTLVEAHNVMFERCVWGNIGQDRYLWPSILTEQWRCSAAKAAACAIPRALEDAGAALHLHVVKDMAGNRVMKRLSKPAKKRKVFKPIPPEDWTAVYEYNEQDVAAEQALSEALPDLDARELAVWKMDQRINARGIPCDVEGAQKAVALAEDWTAALNIELNDITQGAVTKATQRQRVLGWLQAAGVDLWNTQAQTLDTYLDGESEDDALGLVDPKARRVIEIVRSIGRSSVGKYQTLIDTAHDGRLHDTQLYHGATTGRWTAKRFQPHNIPRGDAFNSNAKMAAAWEYIHASDLDGIRLFYGDPMTFLSHVLRGVIQADAGKLLYCGDYSAVETRVLFWLADELKGLGVFARNADIYIDMAADIYGHPYEAVTKHEREVGKRAVLGLGFGMGYIKFLITCRGYGIRFSLTQILEIVGKEQLRAIAAWINAKDWPRCRAAGMTLADLPELALMRFIVNRYRARYKDTVVKLWHSDEDAAKKAFENPGIEFTSGKSKWLYDAERFLTAELPSGRKLFYPYPALDEDGLTHMGIDSKTHQWVRERTYGGKLVENRVQATARDVMADAGMRLDVVGGVYEDVIMFVHDEIVCQSASGNVDEFTRIISKAPTWAAGLPIKAESWCGKRYRK